MLVFFFKQKTAYEMRISDWSSDVCSSDLVGNDQNEMTGLYGSTGAMRVWSGLFSRLPSTPLKVGNEGLDWQWVAQSSSTDASCPDARRFPFAKGYAPPYQPCVYAQPEPEEEQGGGWRSWFGLDPKPRDPAREVPQPAPTPPPHEQR